MPALSNGTQKVTGLIDPFMRRMNYQSAREMPCKQSNILIPNGILENSDETLGEDIAQGFNIKGLIDCIKELHPRKQAIVASPDSAICSSTEQVRSRDSVKRTQPQANFKECDAKTQQTSLNGHMSEKSNKSYDTGEGPSRGIPFVVHTGFMSEDEKGSNLDVAAFDDIKAESIPRVPLPASKEGLDKTPTTIFTKEGCTQNKLLVRFLSKKVEDSDIMSAFEDCGSIVKTRKGLQNALKKTDLMIRSANVIVEATTSIEDAPNRISIPKLIGDPDVPAALVKNPTRTVKIKQLTHDISSQQVQEALTFCKSGISGFFLGSSSSVAYVEFETEDAKERAITKHSIYVSGKQLLIFRIDAPRTPIIRISNVKNSKSVSTICNSYGEVNYMLNRQKFTMDVHFKIIEWPNMLSILNRLNGMEVDGSRWLAQPAPVFPPEVLKTPLESAR